MDKQENTTSKTAQGTIHQQGIHSVKSVSIFFISTMVFFACYLLIPLGVFQAAAELASQIGTLIPAILSVFAVWFVPGIIAIGLAMVMWVLLGQKDESVVSGWIVGIMAGVVVLTAAWFLPLWAPSYPVFAEILHPLRVSALFEKPWLMGLSWLICIPMMAYVNIYAVATTNEDPDFSKTVKKQSTRSSSSSQPKHPNPSTTESDIHSDKSIHKDRNSSYEWKPAPNTHFNDIGGMDVVKAEIEQSVLRPLTRIDAAYERFNISPPNGILLYGPPGTGKTLFARAVAGELGHPYLELSAGDIKSKWINESTEKVNQLFTETEQFDRCVIFIDEIDALLAGRGNGLHREHAQVVNEFLAHLDDEDPNFLLIAATNRPDLLDEAATRRGRFDQQYEIGLPDQDARAAIFRVRLRDLPTTLHENAYQQLADCSKGLSSADIVGIVDDAAMRAAERDAEALTFEDLRLSFPRNSH